MKGHRRRYSLATLQRARGIKLEILMIPEATADIPLLQPRERGCAGGRQAVVLIEVFCCME